MDDLGWMNPHQDVFEVNKERVEHWIHSGAQPTASAHNILVRAGIIKAPKIPVHAKSKKKEGEAEATGMKETAAPPAPESITQSNKEAASGEAGQK